MSGPLAPLAGMLAGEAGIAEILGAEGAVVAVPEAARPLLLAALRQLSSAPVLVAATPTSAEAERLAHDLSCFLGPEQVLLVPAWETLPFERISPSTEAMGARLRALDRLRAAHADPAAPGPVVVAPVKALLQRLGVLPEQAAPTRITSGQHLDIEGLLNHLVAGGYRREYQVEHRGEVAVRGGIIDVFPSTGETPVRIDCFGDEVDRLMEFDLSDQRSVGEVPSAELYACRELLLTEEIRARAAELVDEVAFAKEEFDRIAHGELFDGVESFLPWLVPEVTLLTDLLGGDDRVVLFDARRMRDRASELEDEESALAHALASTWGAGADLAAEDFPRLHAPYERLLERSPARAAVAPAVADSPDLEALRATGWPAATGDPGALARRVGELAGRGVSVVVTAEGAGSAERIAGVLEDEGVVLAREHHGEQLRERGVHVVVCPLERGFVLESSHLAVLTEGDLTGRRRAHRAPKARARPVEGFFDDLAPGSYVVHRVHGVGRYGGMVTRELGGAARDYLLLEYRSGDKLYIPSDQIDVLTPYSGGEQPALHRLNGNEWQRQRSRVRAAAREVAQELVVLYPRRLAAEGHAFSPDTPWQREFEQAFPFIETADQLRAIDEVKADMERASPMDRLVCGDVGFGKTEVALRAAFKAVQDNKQVAVLVPTTLLAQQHFQTFAERCAPYPVRVEVLSRFLTPAEAKAVVAGIASGAVDIVIGTHRLLGEDVRFSDLGLLVVDEEQRFGVSHKEAVKKLTVGVDVLTLTASPIPRTLEMGLTGIRDLSIIDTPPAARQPILTYVGEEDERAEGEAIRRELLREGQVFFVHNRVHDIEQTARRLQTLVPEARLAIAHGQMDEGTLEQVVLDFAEGSYDVLVCTTIIESGIDMPTVNTLVVDRADLLGLGQLHQLRGRVGRAGQRAYAYLFHPRERVLSEQAYERLRTIGEHTELGSGFKIAMRDLEIRGAGNLLGSDQSGHIAAVGYDLYVQMVAEAVAELKGEPVREPAEIKLDLPVEAHLPASYVEREDLRLEAYRRLSQASDEGQVADIGAEWLDRFGPLPRPAAALLAVGRVRAECVRLGIRELTGVPARPGSGGTARVGEVVVRFSPVALPASARVRLQRLAPRALYKEELGQVIVPLAGGASFADGLAAFLSELLPPALEAAS